MTAAQKGFIEIVKYLLAKGANPNIQDRVSYTAISNYSRWHTIHLMIYRVLQEHKTALIVAVMNNQIVCIKPLMERGANPNLYSKNGWTALYIAANRGFLNIVKELIDTYGVSKNADGTTPVHKLEIDMGIQNTVGGNVLMVACMQGHLEIVEVLTKMGANVNGKDNVSTVASRLLAAWRTCLTKSAYILFRTIGQPS